MPADRLEHAFPAVQGVKPVVEGRRAKRRRETRARLLAAAHEVMSQVGVGAATIKDITKTADVGFGTFYSYFESKEALAAELLDCIIDDVARRNDEATAHLGPKHSEMGPALRARLLLRAAVADPLWRWWAHHPELLFDRLDQGLGPFVKRDIREGIRQGELQLPEEELEGAWTLAVWVIVGGIHDIGGGNHRLTSEIPVVEAVLRMLGTQPAKARAFASAELPTYPPSRINWNFALGGSSMTAAFFVSD